MPAGPGAQAPPTTLDQWLALLERRHPRSIDLGLERCGRVYRAMGSPRPGTTVVTVGGTNGKGSAVAWTCALLEGLGRTTAAYTSPHLLRFNERLRLGERLVRDDELVAAFARVEAARDGESLTYFEFTTLACLELMHEHQPDVAVLEVGLGGRLDTVNLVDADLAVIMPIGLDHQEYLGEDRETIGGEKAGILRRGIPLICGEAAPPASVLRRAGELDCAVSLPGRDYHFRRTASGLEFRLSGLAVELPVPLLAGRHQDGNLAAALAAVARLVPDALQRPVDLALGMRRVRLAGRLQALDGFPGVILDVGHNPLAAEVLAEYLEGLGTRPVLAVLGMLADKDAQGVAAALGARVDHWFCAGLEGPRGQAGTVLAARIAPLVERGRVQAFADVGLALAAARAQAGAAAIILVFGSFQTVAEAMRSLQAAGTAGSQDRS